MASRAGSYRPGRFLPPDPRVEAPYRLTPQTVFRIGILGFLVLTAFAVLFFRLWALQVLSGNQFLQAAENNQLRLLRQEAPRGPIKDRYGRILVDNKGGTAIKIWPANLPRHGQFAEVRRLTRILNVPTAEVTRQIEKHRDDPVTPVTVKQFASENEVFYLLEHQTEFPGMQIANTYVRQYPHGDLAAQLMGYVGEINDDQLKQLRGYSLGDKIGQGGIESAFDKELRGQAGLNQLRVDSLGRRTSPVEVKDIPNAGYAVRLTLDAKLQRASQQAVIDGINRAQANKQWYAKAGAIVALDPRDGAIRALASYPSYDPNVFTTRKKEKLAPLLESGPAEEADFPALNRAIAGVYPPGSTFKPVTALAAMQEHILSPYNSLECTGSLVIDGHTFNNWDPNANQAMTLPTAIAQSCDTYFYQVGKLFYDLPADRGQPLQRWAKTFGFGEPTGLDVGPEEAGLVPTIKWRQDTYTKKTDPCCWEIDRLWKSGDSVQLAIGQKDLQVTPLQMARFYALIANRGKLVTPHVVAAVEEPGRANGPGAVPVVRRAFHPPAKELNLDPTALQVVRDGLFDATHSPLGTSSSVFGQYPIGIAGKTGTAEKVVNGVLTDTSWWCGYGPVEAPTLVVCAVIENGGFGGEAAAPSALQVFESYFDKQATAVAPGEHRLMVDYAAGSRVSTRPRARTRDASFLRNLDWVLLFAVAALVAYGLWAIDGITRGDDPADPNYYVNRQALYAAIGIIGMAAMTLLGPSFWRRNAKTVYVVMIALLIIAPVFGAEVRNTRRWIDLGPFRFQPSEFGKLLLVLFLAAFLAERGKRIAERNTTLTAIGLAVLPILLVFLQPDFGTAIVYAAVLGAVLFVAGTSWGHIAAILGGATVLAAFVLWLGPSIGVDILKPYQRARITGFTHPSQDPSGPTYNLEQSITAVGAGGATGRGVSGATQTNYNYLPEHATDFAFASLSEQRGFVGATILLLLYLLVIWRALKVITLARDAFSAIAAGGIAFMLLIQIFINVGMTIGMAPITGIPLPFVSVGGSSMIANLLAIGVLQSICVRRR